jgi:hypothetical protein
MVLTIDAVTRRRKVVANREMTMETDQEEESGLTRELMALPSSITWRREEAFTRERLIVLSRETVTQRRGGGLYRFLPWRP